MTGMTLENITAAIGGTYYGDEEYKSRIIAGVDIDSRRIEKDFLFVPMVGERVDGHRFIADVFEKGALCVLSEHVLDGCDKPYILVESTFQALKDLAAYYREISGVKVVGVTGSVGKTSTKEAIAAVLSQRYNVLKTDGNYNNEVGLPLTIFRIRPEHQIAVLEMGIDSFGEMHRLSQIAKPDICVITNIGYCHLENLGDRDGVLRAKVEIFDYFNQNGAVILNGDDDKLSTIKRVKGVEPVFFGNIGNRVIHTTNTQSDGLTGTNTTLYAGGESIDIHIPITGEHMVYNVMAAAAVAKCMGLTMQEVKNGIEGLKAVNGRNNVINTKVLTIIDDCYNANPVSMKASIDVLSGAAGRKVAILGDMFELGENEVALHREVGRYLAGKNVDLLIATGKLGEELAREAAVPKTMEVVYYSNKQAMINNLSNHVKMDDTILVKASNGMKFNEVVDCLKELKISNLIANETYGKNVNDVKGDVASTVAAIEPLSKENDKSMSIAMFFAIIAFGLNLIYIFDSIMQGQMNIKLGYYFMLLAAISAVILCTVFEGKVYHIIRGISLLILLETLIVANIDEISAMIKRIDEFIYMQDYTCFIWYLTAGTWLIIEGVKSVALRRSRIMALAGAIVGAINVLMGIFTAIGYYDFYSNFIVKVDMYRVFLMYNVFLVFACLVISNIIVSCKAIKK